MGGEGGGGGGREKRISLNHNLHHIEYQGFTRHTRHNAKIATLNCQMENFSTVDGGLNERKLCFETF